MIIKYGISEVLVAIGAGIFVPLMSRWFYLAYNVHDAISGPILGISNLLIAITTILSYWLVS